VCEGGAGGAVGDAGRCAKGVRPGCQGETGDASEGVKEEDSFGDQDGEGQEDRRKEGLGEEENRRREASGREDEDEEKVSRPEGDRARTSAN